MSYVVAGVLSGLCMASVFGALGPIMLFFLTKDPPRALRAIMGRVTPCGLTMGLVVLAYPAWVVVGVAIGLLYMGSAEHVPAGGVGSPNLLFSSVVTVVALATGGLLAVVFKRVVAGVAALAVTFVGVFGWLLPLLAVRLAQPAASV